MHQKCYIFAFIFILNWIFLSGSRDIIWAKRFIQITMVLPYFKGYFCCNWQQHLFKVFTKEFLFFCLRKCTILNMVLEHFGELKTLVALLTFEHLKTQQLVAFKHLVFFIMNFYFLIHTLVCTHLILFSHICMSIYIGEPLF